MLFVGTFTMLTLSSSHRERLSQNLGYMGSTERIQRGRQSSFYIYLFQEGNERGTRGGSGSFTRLPGPLSRFLKEIKLCQIEWRIGNKRPRSTGAFHIQSHLMQGKGGNSKTVLFPIKFPSRPPSSQVHNTETKSLPSQNKALNAMTQRST